MSGTLHQTDPKRYNAGHYRRSLCTRFRRGLSQAVCFFFVCWIRGGGGGGGGYKDNSRDLSPRTPSVPNWCYWARKICELEGSRSINLASLWP